MVSKRKLYAKAAKNPSGLRFSEFTRLIETFGYALDRVRGSHHMYYHANVPEFLNLQPDKNGMAKPYQVRDLLRAIDDFGLSMEET
jgi:hypothetical protein